MESINVAGVFQEAGHADSRACTRYQTDQTMIQFLYCNLKDIAIKLLDIILENKSLRNVEMVNS